MDELDDIVKKAYLILNNKPNNISNQGYVEACKIVKEYEKKIPESTEGINVYDVFVDMGRNE